MENKDFETKNANSTTPIPDLFNTEPELPTENAHDVCSDDKPEDMTSEKAEEIIEPKNADEVTVAKSETEETNPEESKLLHDEVATLNERILSLEKLFNAKIMHSEHEKKIVDQMHRELQKYKDDMYAQLIRPILLDVIAIRDSILKQLKEYQNRPEDERHIPLQVFETYAYDTEEILARNNIEFYNSEVQSDFVPVRQRVIKKVATDDQSLHSKIAESIIGGYSYNGKTISPEKVSVYVYEQKQEQEVSNNIEEESQNG